MELEKRKMEGSAVLTLHLLKERFTVCEAPDQTMKALGEVVDLAAEESRTTLPWTAHAVEIRTKCCHWAKDPMTESLAAPWRESRSEMPGKRYRSLKEAND